MYMTDNSWKGMKKLEMAEKSEEFGISWKYLKDSALAEKARKKSALAST
jgi:hypothetical protein